MLKVEFEKVLYEDPRFMAAFPTAAPAGEGFVCAFHRAPDDRVLMSEAARAGARNYSQMNHLHPRSELAVLRLDRDLNPVGGPVRVGGEPDLCDQDGSLFVRPDGTLGLLSFQWYVLGPPTRHGMGDGIHFAGTAKTTGTYFLLNGASVRASADHGATWTGMTPFAPLPAAFAQVEGGRLLCGGAVRGRVIALAPDRLGVATYAARGTERTWYTAFFYTSEDGGRTWRYGSVIASGEADRIGYAEPSLVRTGDGSMLAFIRTVGHGDQVVRSRSRDGGASWSAPRDAGWTGHPVDAQMLADGRLLLAYGRRAEKGTLNVRVIERPDTDEDAGREFAVSRYAWGKDCGYPWLVPLDPARNRFAVFHYRTQENGVRALVVTVFSLA